MEEQSVQLGFGICANHELHGDIEYYYVVEHAPGGTIVRAYAIEHDTGVVRVGRVVHEGAVPQPFSSSSFFAHSMQRVRLHGVWFFRDDRLREFRRCDNPHERITFDELFEEA